MAVETTASFGALSREQVMRLAEAPWGHANEVKRCLTTQLVAAAIGKLMRETPDPLVEQDYESMAESLIETLKAWGVISE